MEGKSLSDCLMVLVIKNEELAYLLVSILFFPPPQTLRLSRASKRLLFVLIIE